MVTAAKPSSVSLSRSTPRRVALDPAADARGLRVPGAAVVVSPQVEPADWDRFVDSRPDATAYHRWGWRQVFTRAFGHRAEYLVAREAGEIVGVLPLVLFERSLFGRFAVSLPFVNYGGVLAATDAAGAALLDEAARLAAAARAAHVEFRHRARLFPALPARQHKVGMLLPLAADERAMWDALDRKVRNQVRKAEKSGLQTATGGAELLDDFYQVFARNMRDLGTPVYSRAFFSHVLAAFPDSTRIVVVKQGAVTVAAGIAHAFRHTLEVPWASSLRAVRALCPNNLLYWTIIREAISDGFRRLDFGRSTPDEGTFHFKRQWGAEPVPLYWEYRLLSGDRLPDYSPANPKFKTAIAVWKRLPLALTTRLGPWIVRGIP